MKQYLHIIREEIPSFTDEEIFEDVKNTSLNSIDLLVVRGVLERYFGFEIPDELWFRNKTIGDSLNYFHTNSNQNNIDSGKHTKKIEKSEVIEVRMPQMANEGLSESWLLKYLGDFHWNLISLGFNMKSSEFYDNENQRLYATFVRINYSLPGLRIFTENEMLNFSGKIESYGKSTFISEIVGSGNRNTIDAKLMTVFSVKIDNGNVIDKAKMDGINNTIPQIKKVSGFLTDYNAIKKGLIAELDTAVGKFDILNNEVLFEKDYYINPFIYINGVGLLYFAAYPIISDACLLSFSELKGFSGYETIYRDILYYGNCDANDLLKVQLHSLEKTNDKISLITSIIRKKDNYLLAKIITIKKASS